MTTNETNKITLKKITELFDRLNTQDQQVLLALALKMLADKQE